MSHQKQHRHHRRIEDANATEQSIDTGDDAAPQDGRHKSTGAATDYTKDASGEGERPDDRCKPTGNATEHVTRQKL